MVAVARQRDAAALSVRCERALPLIALGGLALRTAPRRAQCPAKMLNQSRRRTGSTYTRYAFASASETCEARLRKAEVVQPHC